MAKHIGIAAVSAEGAALCYRTICAEAAGRMGPHDHPEISMHTHPLARYLPHQRAGNWRGIAELLLDSARKLASVGAEFLICPANTPHQAMGFVEPESPLRWLHIAREVVRHAQEQGFGCLAVLGTNALMTGPVYADAAAGTGVKLAIPDDDQRREVNRMIYDELVYGKVLPESRERLHAVMAAMKGLGCDAAVLGCTELPLLADPETAPLPLLDSTRLLARAALREAIL
jgi:aspartate racemase